MARTKGGEAKKRNDPKKQEEPEFEIEEIVSKRGEG